MWEGLTGLALYLGGSFLGDVALAERGLESLAGGIDSITTALLSLPKNLVPLTLDFLVNITLPAWWNVLTTPWKLTWKLLNWALDSRRHRHLGDTGLRRGWNTTDTGDGRFDPGGGYPADTSFSLLQPAPARRGRDCRQRAGYPDAGLGRFSVRGGRCSAVRRAQSLPGRHALG